MRSLTWFKGPKADLGRASLDHLIGGHEQLELGGVLHRQVAGLVALEDASDVLADLAVQTGNAGSVTHQTTGERIFAPRIGGGNSIACCECNELSASAIEDWISADEQRLSPLPNQGIESRLEIILNFSFESQQRYFGDACGRFHILHGPPVGTVFGINQRS